MFIDSKLWAEKIANIVNTPVTTMLQCTEINLILIMMKNIKQTYYS